MKNRIVLSENFRVGDISEGLWGSFIEHMGRAVYGGIYEPGHPTADGKGFRGDVKALIGELNVPLIRYPGGNFLSGYDWRDGVGKERPARLDMAWGQLEPNAVGLHEFCGYAEELGARVMMSVNMGTGSPKDAASLVEYCNHPKGSALSDMRARNGRQQPFGIKTWCIGNEMDGDWQICALTADEYGRKAAEAAKLMRWVDKDVELVVCGSSDPFMKTYPEWDRKVLEYTYPYVDYISLHRYYSYTSGRIEDFLASHLDLDAFIKTVKSTIEYVRAYKRSRKRVYLSLDEWNIWHRSAVKEGMEVYNGEEGDRWTVGPRRIENLYDYADALAFAGLMITMIDNCDSVKLGCLAQLVNVIAPIYTENGGAAVRQTIFYPYLTALRYAHGTALQPVIECASDETEYGASKSVHAAAVVDGETLTLFLLHKSAQSETFELTLDFEAEPVEEIALAAPGLDAKNTFARPDAVTLVEKKRTGAKSKSHTLTLEPYSYSVVRFKK